MSLIVYFFNMMKYFWQQPTRRKLFTSKALITAEKQFFFNFLFNGFTDFTEHKPLAQIGNLTSRLIHKLVRYILFLQLN